MATIAELEKAIVRQQTKVTAFGDPEDQVKLDALVEELAAAKSRSAPTQHAQDNSEHPDMIEISLNLESFREGGQNYTPPLKEGLYQGICDGIVTPTSEKLRDQSWFVFRGAEVDGEGRPIWRGALVCGGLNKITESGAWKVKQVLDALGVQYTETAHGVRFNNPKGRPAHVQWSNITYDGKTSMRIQDVFRAEAKVAQII